jgi:hypothetical protein
LSGFQIAAAILFLSFKNWTHLAGFWMVASLDCFINRKIIIIFLIKWS